MSDKIQYVKDYFSDYLSNDAISASDLKNFLKSPLYFHYKKYEEQKENTEETKSLAFGTLLHKAILEPDTFFDQYAIAKKFDQRTTAGKEGLKDFFQENKGKKIITYEDFEMAMKISANARKNKTLGELLNNSYHEMSLYSEDVQTGLKVRLRPDAFVRNKNIIVDIKSCQESSMRSFKKDVFTYGYDITAMFYKHFSNKQHYIFASCEKCAPFQVSLFTLGEDLENRGANLFHEALDLLSFCYKNDVWPDYNSFQLMRNCRSEGTLDKYLEVVKNDNLINEIK